MHRRLAAPESTRSSTPQYKCFLTRRRAVSWAGVTQRGDECAGTLLTVPPCSTQARRSQAPRAGGEENSLPQQQSSNKEGGRWQEKEGARQLGAKVDQEGSSAPQAGAVRQTHLMHCHHSRRRVGGDPTRSRVVGVFQRMGDPHTLTSGSARGTM